MTEHFSPEVAGCRQTQMTKNHHSMNSSPGSCADTEVAFEGGTKRSGRKPHYHLVPLELMEAVANTRTEGDQKYAPGNWMQGSREFFVDCLGHAIEHLMLCSWDDCEDIFTHLGHAACNIGFILWALKRNKVTPLDLQRAAVIALDEKREAQIKASLLQCQVSMPSTSSSSKP